MISYKRGRVSDMIYLHSPKETTDLISFDSPDKVLALPLIRSQTPIKADPRQLAADSFDNLSNNNPFDAVVNKTTQCKDAFFQTYVEKAMGYPALSASLGTATCFVKGIKSDHSDYSSDLSSGSKIEIVNEIHEVDLDPGAEKIHNEISYDKHVVSENCYDEPFGADQRASLSFCLSNGTADAVDDLSILNDSEMDDSLIFGCVGENDGNQRILKNSQRSNNASFKAISEEEKFGDSSKFSKFESFRVENVCGKTNEMLSDSFLQSNYIDESITTGNCGIMGHAILSEQDINLQKTQTLTPSVSLLQRPQHGIFKTRTHMKSNLSPFNLCKLARPKKMLMSPKFPKSPFKKNCRLGRVKSVNK